MSISQFHLFVFIFGMFTCPLWGQVPSKKLLTEDDFKEWGRLRAAQISNNGNWVSYPIDYIELKDTLVVVNPKDDITYKIPEGSDGTFVSRDKTTWFVFKKENKGVGMMNLDKGSIKWVENADYYKVSQSGKLVVCVKFDSNHSKNLKILKLGNENKKIIKGITDFAFSPDGSQLAYSINKNSFSKIVIRDWNRILYSKKAGKGHSYHKIVWNSKGTELSFMDEMSSHLFDVPINMVINWDFKSDATIVLNPLKSDRLSGYEILSNLLYYSEDDTKLIFNISPICITSTDKNAEVQEWKGTDPWVYPRIQQNWKWENQQWKTIWWPHKNKLLPLGNEETPQVILDPQQQYAVVFSQMQYEPQYYQTPYSDFYIVDLETGKKNLIVENVKAAGDYFRISPEGKYISYFKDEKWWVYNVELGSSQFIENPEKSSFSSAHKQNSLLVAPFGNPGWTAGDKQILLYDEHDIWAISPDGKKAERLTKGRKEKIKFRIDNYTTGRSPFTRSVFHSYGYDLKKNGMILIGKKHDVPFAYYKLDNKAKTTLIAEASGRIENLRTTGNSKTMVFMKESSEKPPSLHYLHSLNPKPIKIYQSNPHYLHYSHGKTKRYNYLTPTGENLAAILHYPDDFKKGVKYPMIVHIYEKMSNAFHKYQIPTYYEQDGFNSRVYTANGYFVLKPDILYQWGDPGFSAVECVTSAVKKILENEMVDEKRIGLIGHSFGGYETTFIIGQTDIFKTAVAGAAVTDLTSSYFSVSKSYLIPEIWRYENQQFRMGISYFDDKDKYLKNSPLYHADNINAPLLMWVGKNDGVVSYKQSVELYLALRRLDKKVSMLVYPTETHLVLKKKNQYDLSLRIKNWFDSHLK